MEEYIVDSLEKVNHYLEKFNDKEVKRVRKEDEDLAQTVQIGFIHSLGELAYNIDLITEDREMDQERKDQLYIEASETLRNLTIILKNLIG